MKLILPKSVHGHLVRLGFLFVIIGIGGLLFPVISSAFLDDVVVLESVAGQRERIAYVQELPLGSSTPIPTPDPNRPNVKNRLIIPSAGINMAIYESDSVGVLLKGGWLFPNTSTPDKIGNTVIFGHRFRYLPPVSNTLYNLDKVKVGDNLNVVWSGQIYLYRVTAMKVIEPNDFSVLNQGNDKILTLITCTPLFTSSQRLVMTAEQI